MEVLYKIISDLMSLTMFVSKTDSTNGYVPIVEILMP